MWEKIILHGRDCKLHEKKKNSNKNLTILKSRDIKNLSYIFWNDLYYTSH